MCNKCEDPDNGPIWDCAERPEVSGGLFGINFYGPEKQFFRVLAEDDTSWHQTGLRASIFWLKDLKNVVDEAIRKVECGSNGSDLSR